MKADRKIAMVVNHIKMEDEDVADVAFWLSKSPAERLGEVFRLRQNYFTYTNGSFPKTMEKVVRQLEL
ncbi:MAG: hypothetical protein V4553_07120 [Bacteroidota bacterium]